MRRRRYRPQKVTFAPLAFASWSTFSPLKKELAESPLPTRRSTSDSPSRVTWNSSHGFHGLGRRTVWAYHWPEGRRVRSVRSIGLRLSAHGSVASFRENSNCFT